MPRLVRNPRVTYCISSQVGCALGCTFCATAAWASCGTFRRRDPGSGAGPDGWTRTGSRARAEPSVFIDGIWASRCTTWITCHRANPPHVPPPAGLGLGKGRITVSTSGLVIAASR